MIEAQLHALSLPVDNRSYRRKTVSCFLEVEVGLEEQDKDDTGNQPMFQETGFQNISAGL